MKLLRIILAVLVLCSSAGGAFLTAKLIKVRNHYTRTNHKLAKDYETTYEALEKSRKELAQLKHLSQQATMDWGGAWENVNTQVANAARGLVTIDVGSTSALKLGQGQVVYGFEPREDGSLVYRGEFRTTEVRETASQLAPVFRVRPADTRSWKPGNWHWRTLVPAGMIDRFKAMELQIVEREVVLGDRQRQLAQQDEMIQTAEEQLEMRTAEVLGGEKLSQEPGLAIEHSKGLMAAMEEAEMARDSALAKVDALRREVRELAAEIRVLDEQNRKRVAALNQSPAKSLVRSASR